MINNIAPNCTSHTQHALFFKEMLGWPRGDAGFNTGRWCGKTSYYLPPQKRSTILGDFWPKSLHISSREKRMKHNYGMDLLGLVSTPIDRQSKIICSIVLEIATLRFLCTVKEKMAELELQKLGLRCMKPCSKLVFISLFEIQPLGWSCKVLNIGYRYRIRWGFLVSNIGYRGRYWGYASISGVHIWYYI